jgi:hypothetical protein
MSFGAQQRETETNGQKFVFSKWVDMVQYLRMLNFTLIPNMQTCPCEKYTQKCVGGKTGYIQSPQSFGFSCLYFFYEN